MDLPGDLEENLNIDLYLVYFDLPGDLEEKLNLDYPQNQFHQPRDRAMNKDNDTLESLSEAKITCYFLPKIDISLDRIYVLNQRKLKEQENKMENHF